MNTIINYVTGFWYVVVMNCIQPVCASQAVLAAKAGATYVSPFVGRLDDQSIAGLEVVRSISELYRIHGMNTKVLSASIRSVQRAIRSWYNGAEICTMPPKVFDQMYDHILTDKGMEIFEKDWNDVVKSNFVPVSNTL